MPRFAANLSMLFNEVPLMQRFDRAGAAGFRAIEFLFPYDEDVPAIKDALDRNGLEQILFNLPAGNFGAGERGIANDPARVQEFRDGVGRALEIAAALNVPRLNCLAGLTLPDMPYEKQIDTLCANLEYAAEQAQSAGVRQLLEPLNTIDTPGFIVPTSSMALKLLDRIGHANLWLQYDFYHQQRMEGNITAAFAEYLPRIAHVQIADSPARHQPGTGEIQYPFVFQAIDDSGYDGWVSLEYRPLGTTEESLSWMTEA
ncbi:MAG TPA: hydroxypyruvate isomerase family protein [Thermomicrobiales bacterium]|nr:hydroxypyruvate isomerase family protein [Thermomicrobiales bacterium]